MVDFEVLTGQGWDQDTQDVTFASNGNLSLTLSGGTNYGGKTGITSTGALTATLTNLSDGYDLYSNTEEFDIDFLLMGSGSYTKEEGQALANKLIAVAETRKDAMAFISPHKGSFISGAGTENATIKGSETITDNVLEFYSSITSSTYAVLDSGYKYMFDRFGNTFRYIPLNGDIAGTCAKK